MGSVLFGVGNTLLTQAPHINWLLVITRKNTKTSLPISPSLLHFPSYYVVPFSCIPPMTILLFAKAQSYVSFWFPFSSLYCPCFNTLWLISFYVHAFSCCWISLHQHLLPHLPPLPVFSTLHDLLFSSFLIPRKAKI